LKELVKMAMTAITAETMPTIVPASSSDELEEFGDCVDVGVAAETVVCVATGAVVVAWLLIEVGEDGVAAGGFVVILLEVREKLLVTSKYTSKVGETLSVEQ
jgi:hypothetical protein